MHWITWPLHSASRQLIAARSSRSASLADFIRLGGGRAANTHTTDRVASARGYCEGLLHPGHARRVKTHGCPVWAGWCQCDAIENGYSTRAEGGAVSASALRHLVWRLIAIMHLAAAIRTSIICEQRQWISVM